MHAPTIKARARQALVIPSPTVCAVSVDVTRVRRIGRDPSVFVRLAEHDYGARVSHGSVYLCIVWVLNAPRYANRL